MDLLSYLSVSRKVIGSPTAGHDVNWARMEILDVQGDNITVKITSRYSNGTTENTTSILNLATGHMIDDFIVPADLKNGDKFYDENYMNTQEPHDRRFLQ